MPKACRLPRILLFAIFPVFAVLSLAGCHPIDFYPQQLQEPLPPALEPPTELAKMSLPAYRIEPPDLIQIEMLKQVPLPPYRAKIYDVLQIQVVGTLLDQPIADFYLVEGEGTVNLGPAYGSVRVVGMTMEEIKAVMTRHLQQILMNPGVSVKLARTSGMQPVTGEYLVGPDGTINLRQYGSVNVAGKSVPEAKAAIEKYLSQFFASPEVSINVIAFNSKVYYIITEGANLGDNIAKAPITGNETVLDAIANLGGLSQLSSKRIWIARPAPGDHAFEQILPVDYDAITRGAATDTNYQLMPGDRVFIAEDRAVAFSNLLQKITAPLERIAGIGSLYGSTIRNLQTLGRSFNRRNF